MNMGQLLMQGLTANNPALRQVLQMKNSGMSPMQVMQQMAQTTPQMKQLMQNPQQAAMDANTAELIRRINPSPVPAYQVPAPYPFSCGGCGC